MDPHVERAFEAFNDHDPEGVVAAFAEGGTFEDPVGDEPMSAAAFGESCAEMFEGFPDARWEVERVMTGPDGTTAVEATFYGTLEGSFEGIEPTGESVELSAVSVITVGEDGITHWRDYWDQQTFKRQLGLASPSSVDYRRRSSPRNRRQ
jgi:steroid delta-isomerase-like uncharacterized protein